MTDTETRAGNTGPRKAKMFNANTNSNLTNHAAYSVVGEMVAAALWEGTANVVAVTVNAAGTVAHEVVVEHAGPAGYDYAGSTTLYAADGRYYDRTGNPLQAFDSATVETHVDILLGNCDSTALSAQRVRDAGPIRSWAINGIWDLV